MRPALAALLPVIRMYTPQPLVMSLFFGRRRGYARACSYGESDNADTRREQYSLSSPVGLSWVPCTAPQPFHWPTEPCQVRSKDMVPQLEILALVLGRRYGRRSAEESGYGGRSCCLTSPTNVVTVPLWLAVALFLPRSELSLFRPYILSRLPQLQALNNVPVKEGEAAAAQALFSNYDQLCEVRQSLFLRILSST